LQVRLAGIEEGLGETARDAGAQPFGRAIEPEARR